MEVWRMFVGFRRFSGQVVSAIDSHPKSQGSNPECPRYLYLTSAALYAGEWLFKCAAQVVQHRIVNPEVRTRNWYQALALETSEILVIVDLFFAYLTMWTVWLLFKGARKVCTCAIINWYIKEPGCLFEERAKSIMRGMAISKFSLSVLGISLSLSLWEAWLGPQYMFDIIRR